MKFRKRCLAAFIIVSILATFAIAAITSHTLVRARAGTGDWTVSAYSADASGCETLKAAPGTGLYLYVTKLMVMADVGITVTIGEDESSSAPVTVYFTLPFAGGGPVVFDFTNSPITIGDANSAFVVDANAAGDVYVYAEGWTGGSQ